MLKQLHQKLQQVLPQAELAVHTLPQSNHLRLYLLQDNYPVEHLDTETAQKVMDNPLYWLFCWASGLVLAQEIAAHPEWVKGKVVLDVGSGSGVVAIAAAKTGAKKVIASDIDPVAQTAIRLNAELNQVDINVVGDFKEQQEAVDIITVADVLYDQTNFPLLESLLTTAPVLLADSRVKNFQHPQFRLLNSLPGETFPQLGGFDEFRQVNLFQSHRHN